MPNNANPLSFDVLPEDVQEWLSSELISYEIGKIIERLKIAPQKERLLALLIGRIAIKKIPASSFILELMKGWGVSASVAQLVATEVKNTVLKPITSSLWKNLQIDVADLTVMPDGLQPPTAREIAFVRTEETAKKSEPGARPVQQPAPRPIPQPQPKAKVMEFSRVSDVRRPPEQKNTPAPTPAKPRAPEPTVHQTSKPFGLSEVAPQAPAPHEVVPYQDEHPAPHQ